MLSPDDTAAVEALVHAYATRLDGGDLDGVARLFEHATWRTGRRVLRGSNEVRAAYRPVLLQPDGRPGTLHVLTNLIVSGDAPAARSRCYFTVLQGARVILAGRYHDTFARVDGRGWHFTDRLILADLRGDLSGHYR